MTILTFVVSCIYIYKVCGKSQWQFKIYIYIYWVSNLLVSCLFIKGTSLKNWSFRTKWLVSWWQSHTIIRHLIIVLYANCLRNKKKYGEKHVYGGKYSLMAQTLSRSAFQTPKFTVSLVQVFWLFFDRDKNKGIERKSLSKRHAFHAPKRWRHKMACPLWVWRALSKTTKHVSSMQKLRWRGWLWTIKEFLEKSWDRLCCYTAAIKKRKVVYFISI